VSGVKVAIFIGPVVGAPESCASSSVHIWHLPTKLVNVSGFTVSEFSKNPLTTHVEEHEFFATVVHILKHHAVFLCGLCNVDEFPCFFDRCREWNFNANVRACFHGINCHRCVPFPWSYHINEVWLGFCQHLFVGVFVAMIQFNVLVAFSFAVSQNFFLRPLAKVFVEVADANKFRAFKE